MWFLTELSQIDPDIYKQRRWTQYCARNGIMFLEYTYADVWQSDVITGIVADLYAISPTT
jgi:hypothetical protein